METIVWKQIEHNLLLWSIPLSVGNKGYIPEPLVINHLVSNRIVNVYILLENQEEKIFSANFNGLKPLAGKARKGIIKTLTESKEGIPANRCAIARGEVYQDRWLTPEGWNETKYWFSLIPSNQSELDESIPKPEANTELPVSDIKIAENSGPTDLSGNDAKIIRCPKCYVINKSEAVKCQVCGTSFINGKVTGSVDAPARDFQDSAIKISPEKTISNTLKYYFWFIVFSILNLLTISIHFIIQLSDVFNSFSDEKTYSVIMMMIIFHSFVGASIFFLSLFYRAWGIIQDQPCRTNPGMAVWLLFIPFYNIIWAFKIIPGLAIDMSNYYKNQNPENPVSVLGAGFAAFFCIIAANVGVWFMINLFTTRYNSSYAAIHTLYFISVVLFLVLWILLASGIKNAYKKIAELKIVQSEKEIN